MKCEKCVAAGLKSTVYAPRGGFTTCMGWSAFYDEDGVYHRHDPNAHSETWQCSNGHRWNRTYYDLCSAPQCGWNEGRAEKITWDVEAAAHD